jgi:hypothetical protein
MEEPKGAPVVLDATGSLRAANDQLGAAAPDAVAKDVCSAVAQLTDRDASVISCSVLPQGGRAFAMVMLREQPAGAFRSGTASADDNASAVIEAVLAALDLEDGILAAVTTRWAAAPDVRAVSVIQRNVVTPQRGTNRDVESHIRLTQAMPAPGRLAVTTDETEYRVLRFPAMAVAVSASPSAQTLKEVDEWMAKAETLGP